MGEADRAAREIEITPEMIEAGIAPLMGSGLFWETALDSEVRSVVADILQAALQTQLRKLQMRP